MCMQAPASHQKPGEPNSVYKKKGHARWRWLNPYLDLDAPVTRSLRVCGPF